MATQSRPLEEAVNAEEGELLAVVLDTSFSQTMLDSEPDSIARILDSVLVFCGSHLLSSSRNQLAFVACHPHCAKMIYPSSSTSVHDIRPDDSQLEIIAHASQTIKKGLKDLITSWKGVYTTEPLLTGGMSLALCYLAKKISLARLHKITGRIVVISSSGESAHQYLSFMNVFFAAQRKAIMVDACVLENDSGLLQQGCDITGGNYLKVPNVAGLLEYLLWVFLPGKDLRSKLVLPKPEVVDYRTACFCHRNLIDVGYVCSVCLSIFCSFAPICSTCRTHFKFMGNLPSLLKRKSKKGVTLQAPL